MWTDDRFLAGYQAQTWAIEDAPFAAGEPEVALTATLVRRNEPQRRRAVLYVHGWSDYFFQTHLADFWDAQGFDFYALDLRRYGRNLVPGLLAGYITDLADYRAELDEAHRRIIAEGHDSVSVMGHSTGGLIVSLWAADTDLPINGLLLNSPWLDMQGPANLVRALSPLVSGVAAMKPTTTLQTPDAGLFYRSVSDTMDGEWRVDHDYKSNPAFLPRFGWGKAILAGQARVAAGLGLRIPVLSMMSARSNLSLTQWDESVKTIDIVLDVERLAAISWRLGRSVTILRFDNAMHDLILSPRPVRDEVFAEIARWAGAYIA